MAYGNTTRRFSATGTAVGTIVAVLAVWASAGVAGQMMRRDKLNRPNMDDAPVVLSPDALTWTERAEGVRVAVLYGDPDKPGPFVLRLQYPAGYRKAPHHHSGDAQVTVLSGSYFRGYGNVVDEPTALQLTPGTFSVNPGGVVHYEWTTEPAMLEVHGDGPWLTTYVDPVGNSR